jgi:hypothetical protein
MTSVDQQKEEYFWNGIAFLISVALCVISVVLISAYGTVVSKASDRLTSLFLSLRPSA